MKLWTWEPGRQNSGYRKFTLLFSKRFGVDAYILHIPQDVDIPRHSDVVPGHRHYRVNVTICGKIRMHTSPWNHPQVYRIGNWFSFFRPDAIEHWAPPVTKDTYIFSIGWIR